MNKRGWRTAPIVEPSTPSLEESTGIAASMERALQHQFEKISVQPKRDSLFDQITSIINNTKPKYQSVDAAVLDMQDRSGFARYQKQMNDWQSLKQSDTLPEIGKSAQSEDKQNCPMLFKTKPEIKDTFDNYINDTHGNVSIPAILDRVHSIHKRDADESMWNDDQLIEYVGQKCEEAKQMNPHTNNEQGLGKVQQFNDERDSDPSNRDALHSLMPNKAEPNPLLMALAMFDRPRKNIKRKE
jgi:hypothetical protein